MGGVAHPILRTVIPPMTQPDGIARNTFVPMAVPINFAPGLGVSTALVEFWYAETGGNCTTRNETCAAVSSTVNQAAPFVFETTGTYSRMSCAGGCTIQAPGIPGRLMYYDYKLYNSGGSVVYTSRQYAAIVP